MNISHDICIPLYCSSFISFFLLDKAKRRFVRFYFAFFLLSSSYLAVSIGSFLYFLFVSFRLFPPESTFSLAALTVEPIILSREPRYKCAICMHPFRHLLSYIRVFFLFGLCCNDTPVTFFRVQQRSVHHTF